MTTTFIKFSDQTPVGRKVSRGLQMVREGRDVLRDALASLLTMIDGDGSQPAQFGRSVTELIYPDTATAKASWDELNSLHAKLNCPAGATADDVGPAITQACAKHGI